MRLGVVCGPNLVFCSVQENDPRPNASQALGPERLSTGAHKGSDKAKTRPTGAATSVQEASLRDKRPASAAATRSRLRAGAGDTDTGQSKDGQRKDANAQELEQGAGLSAKGSASARLHPSSSSVFSGARSVNGLIRPAAQRYGRVCAALRQDPVSSFLNTREQWKRGPAVTAGGTARATVCAQFSCIYLSFVKGHPGTRICLQICFPSPGGNLSDEELACPAQFSFWPWTAGGSNFLASTARRQKCLENRASPPEWHNSIQLHCAHRKGKEQGSKRERQRRRERLA